MLFEFLKTTLIFITVITAVVLAGIGIVRGIDYIEENPYAAKERIQMVVYTAIALHAFLLYLRVPIYHLLLSLSIQYALQTLFAAYPLIKPEDPRFIYGVLGSLVNHFLLIKFFVDHSYGVAVVAMSFLVIWTTPFCFFFSMSASEDNLFVKSSGKATKTYAGILLEWLMTVGKRQMEARKSN